MQEAKTADVIVVGLGAFGSATTYQLASRGVKVIGIDQFAPPHDRGSSHGASRITRLAVGEGEVYVPLIRRSHAIWSDLESRTGTKLFHRTGGLIMGPQDGTVSHHGKPDFVRRTIANARRFGIGHEVLDASEVSRRYPQFITRGDELAYFEPDSGVLLPELCVETQLRLAESLGAIIRCNEKVVSIEDQGGSVVVNTTLGTYSAAKVIVTAGPWVPALSGGTVENNLRVMRQVLYWFETANPSMYAPERCPIFIWMHGSGDEDYMYGFPMVDGKPGVKVATEQYRDSCAPDGYDRTVRREDAERMFTHHVQGRLDAMIPRVVDSATCLYTVSSDSGFIVDRFREMDNVTVVSACSGHGFKNSAGLGEQLALQAMGSNEVNLTAFGAGRFV